MGMDSSFGILIVIIAALSGIYMFVSFKNSNNVDNDKFKKTNYRYFAKNYIMTQRESSFFKLLNDVLGTKWYIVPQVHLSALLNHKVNGQNWNAAFRHINGKSVDFVLLSKESMKPVCAIELDDASHERSDRMARDEEVERIFKQAKIPLARFRKVEDPSRQDIADAIATTIKGVEG